jgi:5'-nucleotidase
LSNPNPDCWAQTASGRAFDLLDPAPSQVSARDLAEHLAKIPRFAGATPNVAVSVAQHSVIVAEALPLRARPYGILHDAHEYVLGDDQAPKLRALAAIDPGARAAIETLRGRADAAIHTAFGLAWPPPPDIAAAVRHADARALASEKRDYMAPEPKPWVPLPAPFPRASGAWPWPKAAELFLEALRTYCPKMPA